MVGDKDASGVSTYAQADQNYGYTPLWTLPLLIPFLIIEQKIVARLGAGTGVGHGRLIRERFGRDWRTPPLTSLTPLPSSRARRWLMRGRSAYLFTGGALLVVRVIQLSTS